MFGLSLTTNVKNRELAVQDMEKRLYAWSAQLDEREADCLHREKVLENLRVELLNLRQETDELREYVMDERHWLNADRSKLETEKQIFQRQKNELHNYAAKLIADAKTKAAEEAKNIKAQARHAGHVEGFTSGKKHYQDLLSEIDDLQHRLANARHAARRRAKKQASE